ncbi:MAG: hypothetical protein L3J36_03575 [Rhodobacteraceae bacterium]|nr:hypothetical protein [Paracoccaceae bacterium]
MSDQIARIDALSLIATCAFGWASLTILSSAWRTRTKPARASGYPHRWSERH